MSELTEIREANYEGRLEQYVVQLESALTPWLQRALYCPPDENELESISLVMVPPSPINWVPKPVHDDVFAKLMGCKQIITHLNRKLSEQTEELATAKLNSTNDETITKKSREEVYRALEEEFAAKAEDERLQYTLIMADAMERIGSMTKSLVNASIRVRDLEAKLMELVEPDSETID